MERTLQRVRDQLTKQSYAQVFIQRVVAQQKTDAVKADSGGFVPESMLLRPSPETILDSAKNIAAETTDHELAASFSLPLSILQKTPRTRA